MDGLDSFPEILGQVSEPIFMWLVLPPLTTVLPLRSRFQIEI
jgi:hypothetical protein